MAPLKAGPFKGEPFCRARPTVRWAPFEVGHFEDGLFVSRPLCNRPLSKAGYFLIWAPTKGGPS